MTIAAIRKELHQMIDTVDARQLKALYTLLEHNSSLSTRYSEEEREKFYGILNDVESGAMATFDAGVVLSEMRAKIVAAR